MSSVPAAISTGTVFLVAGPRRRCDAMRPSPLPGRSEVQLTIARAATTISPN